MKSKEKKYMEKSKLNEFVKKYSNMNCNGFGIALENLLEENHISKTDLSKIIGVDNQCLTNWTSPSINKPKWLNVMYRMNLFFYDYDKNFDSLCLYDKRYRNEILSQKSTLDIKEQEIEKQKLKYEKGLKDIEYTKSVLAKIKALQNNYEIKFEEMLDDFTKLLENRQLSYWLNESSETLVEQTKDFIDKYIGKF